MKITVNVNIDDELIQQSANSAAKSLFSIPNYGGRPVAMGFVIIAKQVEDAVKQLDFTTIARETAAKFAHGIIEDVTREAIKKMAKEAIKAEKEAGTLLPEGGSCH